jgi:hypothetical protein
MFKLRRDQLKVLTGISLLPARQTFERDEISGKNKMFPAAMDRFAAA